MSGRARGGWGGSERRKDGSNISIVPLVSSRRAWVNNNALVQSNNTQLLSPR